VLVELEERLTLSVGVVTGYSGANNTGFYPSNANLAVGPNYVVEAINETIAIYNKSTGSLVSSQTFPSFFSGFDANGPYGIFDPQVVYDETAGRFLLTAQDDDLGNGKAYVDFAISNSSDPTQGFSQKLQIEVDQGGLYWDDSGKLGWNADAFVYTGNAYNTSNSFDHEDIIIINASNLSDNVLHEAGDSCLIPARMHGSSPGGPMWFAETSWDGGSSINVMKMTNVLSSSPSLSMSSLAVNSYTDLGSAVQPGGTISTFDSRISDVEWDNNTLVAGFNSAVGSDDATAWVEIGTGGSSPTVTQQGVIHPATGVNTYFPAIGIDANGDLFMTYNQSSSSQYMSMYVTGRVPSDAPNTMEAPVEVQAGNTTLSPGRAGDYNGIALDPSSSNSYWATAEYALSGAAASWGTWIAQFQLGAGPLIVNPASANPNSVTSTTTGLSVLGNDAAGQSSLTYTWSVISQPSGATTPSFSVNGTNAAQNTTATFYRAGGYTFQATITDPSGYSVTSIVAVAVNQTATSITVSPSTASVANGVSYQFIASALDQFGIAISQAPSFTWTIDSGGLGTVSSAGLYTAPATGVGAATVRATSGSASGSASVTVVDPPPPWVVTPASASANPVTGTTTGLAVLGNDDAGQSSLTYIWSVISQPAGATTPSFKVNGTNAAQNTTATFYQAGTYTFQATITDTSGLSVTSTVAVAVNQTATSITVSPAAVTLSDGATQQFNATELDQFGRAMATQPSFSWSIGSGGVGSVSSSGLYTAPGSGSGTATVRATSGTTSGAGTVSVSSILAAPSNLTAVAVSRSQVNLAWTTNSTNQTGFVIQRSTNGGSSWTQIATVGPNVTTYSDRTVSKKKTYVYRVAAYNSAGTSAWSNWATTTTPSYAIV